MFGYGRSRSTQVKRDGDADPEPPEWSKQGTDPAAPGPELQKDHGLVLSGGQRKW